MTQSKVTKKYAHYSDHSTDSHTCDGCCMWRNGSCTYVEGKIKADGWCRFWKKICPTNETTNCMGMSSSIQGTGAITGYDPGINAGRLLKRHKLKTFRMVTK